MILNPTNWSGRQSFQVIFELVPEDTRDGYSAAYEFDWVAIQGYEILYLPLVMKGSS